MNSLGLAYLIFYASFFISIMPLYNIYILLPTAASSAVGLITPVTIISLLPAPDEEVISGHITSPH